MNRQTLRRSRGEYDFMQQPIELGMTSRRFRSLYEQGRVVEAMQPINEAMWAMGYGCYAPDYHIENVDLSPGAVSTGNQTVIEKLWAPDGNWRQEKIRNFSSAHVLSRPALTTAIYGIEYIKERFCPVFWKTDFMSSHIIMEAIGRIVAQSFEDEIMEPYILLDNIAVTNEQLCEGGEPRLVVWMRCSYLQEFAVGQQLINVSRMMRNGERVFGIPRCKCKPRFVND